MLTASIVQSKSKECPQIKVVQQESDLHAFVHFPFKLYRKNPFWIPPLVESEVTQLSPLKNPAFEHSTVRLFTAWKNEEMVGRVAGIINHLETQHLGEPQARFGWLDFVDDLDVSDFLFRELGNWATSQGCTCIKGPYGFNGLDKSGMLTEGYQSLGTANTLYNYPYYPAHLEALGFEKDLEWMEIEMKMPDRLNDKVVHATQIAKQRYRLEVYQPKSKADIIGLGHQFFGLIHETYGKLPGFVPISAKQQQLYIEQYIGFVPPEYVCVVKDPQGDAVGFGLTIPSMSKAMQRANGKLFPFGIFHLLAARWLPNLGDLTLIGVKEAWRKKGVPGVIMLELFKTFQTHRIKTIQVNPMLEFNQDVLSLWKDFDYKIYKRRKTFKKLL